MSSSGLIYAVIVGAWAAYLVPMWLRRQDELNEARPTERFSTAIRLLSGRAALERRYAKTADPDEETEGDPTVDVRDLAVPAPEVPAQPRPLAAKPQAQAQAQAQTGAQLKAKKPNPRAKVLAARRRTTTLLFLAFTFGMIVAAVGGVAFLWAPGIPAVLLTFYIAHLRAQERRRFEVKFDQRRAAEAAKRLRDARTAREHVPEAPEVAEPAPLPPAEEPATADRRALVEQTDHAEWVDQQRTPTEDAWEVPAPRPTFSTAPVAPRRTRDRSRTPLFDQHSDRDRPRAANE
ncbi:hypothetical protein ABZ883_36145 [Streptomyces sp. NPDC046977]|uniref:divisome protein SepX/GlpR n=1 Tax=Streptomyces sp. NPDC046977 TaxID=3154703 RepID=UPI0033E2CDD1